VCFRSTCWQWHLGYGQRSELPRARGFDSYLGYWNGAESYSNHTVGFNHTLGTAPEPGAAPVYDFVNETTGDASSTQTAYDAAGKYSTHVFSQRAVEIIIAAAAEPRRVPWFLYLVSLH
jgi:hypothetical protein